MKETRSQGLARLKESLLAQRGFKCEVCGRPEMVLHLHHGIVSQGDIIGWHGAHRRKIDVAYNGFLLCASCHLNKALPAREWFWEQAVRRYGIEAVKAWYDSLPFKGPRPRYDTVSEPEARC